MNQDNSYVISAFFFFYKQTLNLPIILLKPRLEVYVAITNSSQGRKTGSWLKSI